MENFTKYRFVRFFYLFSELICNETKSAAAASISLILTSVSRECVPLRAELQHRGRKCTLILAVFQVLFNITYVNGQVYLNDFPMKSGVAHITCQTIICEYSLFLFYIFYFPPSPGVFGFPVV